VGGPIYVYARGDGLHQVTRLEMRRAPSPFVSGLVIVFALGCRPNGSTAEPSDAAELEHLRAQQQELRERLAAAEARADAHDETRARLQELTGRVTELEDAAKRTPVRMRQPDPDKRYRVDLDGSHARGPEQAPVTIVEWVDFECGFSLRVQVTLKLLESRYPDKIRIVFKHLPLQMHRRSRPAALAAEAAGRQGKFWEMQDRIWENYRDLTDATFERLARQLRLDVSRFKRDLQNPTLQDRVRRDEEQASQLAARGTPSFFINGRFLSGAQPVESFSKMVDEELAKAQRLVASGTPPDRIYETLMRDAVAPGS
jgi:protein-disulfide isomerase